VICFHGIAAVFECGVVAISFFFASLVRDPDSSELLVGYWVLVVVDIHHLILQTQPQVII